MGNCPSISLVVRTIAPAWKTAWLVSSETVASSTLSEERMRPSSFSARAGMLASISPLRPGLLQPVESEDFRYLVMPIRLNV